MPAGPEKLNLENFQTGTRVHVINSGLSKCQVLLGTATDSSSSGLKSRTF